MDAEVARDRILQAARTQFAERGFADTSLADIGAEVGLTRGAVLYHFGSKERLLQELLAPFVEGLDAELTRLERLSPTPSRAHALDVILELFATSRAGADLLARDISARAATGLDAWVTSRLTRLVHVLSGTDTPTPVDEVRALAAIGAMIRPLAVLPPGRIGAAQRGAIRDAARAALGI